MAFNLDALASVVLDDSIKGIPFGATLKLADVGSQGWSMLAGDLPLPAAVIRADALAHNSRWMQRFVAERGALIAPHVKTTMCPQIIARQIADGAWGVTVATVQQMRVCRTFGADRIILANQAVGRSELDAIAAMAGEPDLDFMMIVDSAAGIEAAAEAVRRNRPGRPLQLLVERGYQGGRTGCRTNDSAIALARQVRAIPELRLVGIEAFEGLIKTEDGQPEQAVELFMDEVAALFGLCAEEGLFESDAPLVTAGGSSYYDVVIDRLAKCGARVVTRSGCYVTHDSGLYRSAHERLQAKTGDRDGLRRALEIWAYVQSIPEPGLALLTAGRRDCGTDSGFPIPLLLSHAGAHPWDLPAGCEVVNLNDQHAYMRFPPDLALAVGDRVGLGISHPCTTFDKWQVIYLVDGDYRVMEAMKTFF